MANNCGCGVPFVIEDDPVILFEISCDDEEVSYSPGDPVIVAQDYEEYTGETTVTPKVKEQTILPTAGKVLNDDITVTEVPVSIVTSPSGGLTYYID